MIKIVATGIYMIIFSIMGVIVRKIATAFSVQTLFSNIVVIQIDKEINIKVIYRMSRDLSLGKRKF
jgi:hypothetical protein